MKELTDSLRAPQLISRAAGSCDFSLYLMLFLKNVTQKHYMWEFIKTKT